MSPLAAARTMKSLLLRRRAAYVKLIKFIRPIFMRHIKFSPVRFTASDIAHGRTDVILEY